MHRQGLFYVILHNSLILPKTEHLFSETRKGIPSSSQTVSDHLYSSALFTAADASISLGLLRSVFEGETEMEDPSLLQKKVKRVE